MTSGPIIIFDADCVLCSGMVAFVLRHERGPVLRFASSQSETGQARAAAHGIDRAELDRTFLVIDGERAFKRSDAAFEIARYLQHPWGWTRALRAVPRPLRDWAYDRVALNRYRLFGRQANCVVVPPDQRARFLGG